MLVTALAPHIGYDNAAKIAKTALKNNTTLKDEIIKSGLMDEKEYYRIVDPKKMIYSQYYSFLKFVPLFCFLKPKLFYAFLLFIS